MLLNNLNNLTQQKAYVSAAKPRNYNRSTQIEDKSTHKEVNMTENTKTCQSKHKKKQNVHKEQVAHLLFLGHDEEG